MANGQNLFNFSDFLESQPRALYQSFVTDPNNMMPSSMKRYYQNQFQNIQDEYLGTLARQMRQGNLPTQTFQNYLTDVFKPSPQWKPSMGERGRARFSGYERFRRESPYARASYGTGPFAQNLFAPSTRWITY